jgi:serine protease Do
MPNAETGSNVFLAEPCSASVRRLRLLAIALISGLALVIVPAGQSRADSAVTGLRPADVSADLGTAVAVPDSLKEIYERGGVPRSLEQLKQMELQQQRVASRVGSCTVSVAIGAAQGCGVIVTGSGYVLTAAHVGMRPGKTAIIRFTDGRTVAATTMGMNRSVDAGLMKINDGQNGGRPWPHATLGRSENLQTGMWCIASGHPGGFEQSRGPVTRVGRILSVREDSLVTDCALIGGDSGGPLFDLAGKLIAVHSRIGNDVADNLHIPIEHYDKTWTRLVANEAWGFLPGFRPILGVSGSPNSSIARIDVVRPGTPAEQAGLLAGDVVERFGEVTIRDFHSLTVAVNDTMPGERVPCLVRRGNDQIRVIVEIGRAE